jgi:hypothetical protein
MSRTSHLYQACHDLFDAYPLAVVAVEEVPTMHSMILMLADGDDVSFFVLLRDSEDGSPAYMVIPWDADGGVPIEPAGGDVPDPAVNAVLRGVPLPQDGSLFGWIHGELVTPLIVVYTRYTPDRPTPTWSVLPLAGTPESDWPPFAGERLFGHWFWDHYRAGNIIDLASVIAATADTVFWVDTYAALGSDCCVVACDVKTPDEHILRRGTYVSSASLRVDTAVPTLAELLADAGKVDLAPRFRVPAHCSY